MKKRILAWLGGVPDAPADGHYLREHNKWVKDEVADVNDVIGRVRQILNK